MTPWTSACQALLSLAFSRQEYWSGLPYPPGDLPNPGIELRSPAFQADCLPSEPPGKPNSFKQIYTSSGILSQHWTTLRGNTHSRAPHAFIINRHLSFSPPSRVLVQWTVYKQLNSRLFQSLLSREPKQCQQSFNLRTFVH